MSTRKAKPASGGQPTLTVPCPTYIPEHPLIQTDVAVVCEDKLAEAMTAERVNEIGQQLGMVAINDRTVKAITALGIHVEGMGVVKLARGFAYLSSAAMANCITALNAKIETVKNDIEQLRAIAYPLGYLADKLSKTSRNSVEANHSSAPITSPAGGRRKTFQPHSMVGVTFEVK